MLQHYRVFVVQDVEGIDFEPEEKPPLTDDLLLEDLEVGYQPLRALAEVRLEANYPKACYQPLLDTICMPGINNCNSSLLCR